MLLFSVVMSVFGALFEVSILSNSQYMLDMITFKRCKISQLVPILTVGLVICLTRSEEIEKWEVL